MEMKNPKKKKKGKIEKVNESVECT